MATRPPLDMSQLPNLSASMQEVKHLDEAAPERFIDYGSPLLNHATLGLDQGVMLIAAPPNVGKSTLLTNMYINVLDLNPGAIVLDFSLDDSRQDRIRNAVASLAKLPINYVKLPNSDGVTDDMRTARSTAYMMWGALAGSRLRIIDETDFDNKGRFLSTITEVVKRVADNAQKNAPGTKVVVVVDGFHNIHVDSGNRMDVNERLAYLSTQLKGLCADTNSIMLASAHTAKGNNRRRLDSDVIKGASDTGYDARIICHVFSDYKANRSMAKVYHDACLPHDPTAVKRLPVIELDVVKNKCSNFSDIIFFKHIPEYASIEEADPTYQNAWKSLVYGRN